MKGTHHMYIFTRAFWAYAGERALKTFAQTAIAGLAVTSVTGILDVAWVPLASAVGLASLLSVLTAIVAYTPGTVYTAEDAARHLED